MTERLHPEGAIPQPEQSARPAETPPTEFQLFMRKVLDLPDYRTEGPAAKTMEELRERIKEDPFSALTEFDALIRGRKVGDLKMWTARNVTNAMIAAAATGADYIDVIVKAPLKGLGAPGEALGAGVEYVMDTAISVGMNKLAEATTGIKGVRYASPLSEFISTAANTIPVFHEYMNGVNLESWFRRTESIPVFGALLERAHISGDRMIEQALTSKENKWLWGLIIIMSKGYNNKPDAKNSTSTPSTSTPTAAKN